MALHLRIEMAGKLYHVTARGGRCEAIYRDDTYRQVRLKVLDEVCERFNWCCHAYCLMDNHYRIVVETPETNLSRGMRQLNGVYTHEQFVERMKRQLPEDWNLREVPRVQRRARAKPLSHYARFNDSHNGMAHAYLSGGYTLQQIADAFGVHYATVSRAVRVKEAEFVGRDV